MKRLTTFLIGVALIFQGAVSLAQIDQEKMERDLRVASSVLSSLTGSDNDDIVFGRGEPEANYVEGFGVVFAVEDQAVFRYKYYAGYESREAQREVQRAHRESQRAHKEAMREINESNAVVAPRPKGTFKSSGNKKEISELMEKKENANKEFSKKLREAFELFLIDYSQLVSQLKPEDKILVTTKNNPTIDFVFAGRNFGNIENKKFSRLSAEMLVKDHKDYASGKLSREKLLAKIKFVENVDMVRKPDLDLFGNMLKTTYNAKYTETYFISSIPRYELLSGLGVVYTVQVFSSYNDDGFFRMPGNKKSGLTEEEREKAVEAMYPIFIDGFKENMIRYGSTIKSLEPTDKLIVKVKMTKCDTCSFPATIEFMVDKSVLGQFSKGSLTLDQAKNKVKLK